MSRAKAATTTRTAVLVVLGVIALATMAAAGSTAAPSVAAPTISGSPLNPSTSTSASFTYSDSQAITKFQCQLDGAGFSDCGTTRPSTKSYPGPLAQGAHTFQVRAVSGSSTSSPTSYSWSIDSLAPTATSVNRANASPTSAASIGWTVTFSEAVKGVDATDFALVNGGLGGAPAISSVAPSSSTLATSFTVTASTGTGSGTLGLNLVDNDSIVDAAGNKLGGTGNGNGNFVGQAYTIDRTPPAAPTIASGPPASPGWTTSTTVSFTFTGETGATFKCKLDSATFDGCSSPKSYSSVAQGSHTFQVLQTDSVGNVGPAASRTFFVDTVAPTTPVFSQTPPNPNSTATSTFAWSSSDPTPASGVAGYQCSKENGAFVTCSSPLTYAVQTTSNGEHQFAVRAVDQAGNVSAVASYKWKVAAGSPQSFTIAGSVSGLTPGVWLAIPVTITNQNAETLYVTGLTVTTSGSPGGCASTTNLEIQASPASPTNRFAVPANATSYAVPPAFRPRIRLKNTPSNQDNCKSQTFSLSYAGSGTNQP